MLTPRAIRDLRHRRSRGQALVLLVFFLMLLIGIAGLAADGGHVYLAKRSVQDAADSSALAAGQKLSTETGTSGFTLPDNSQGTSTSDLAVKAANAFAANNGFVTSLTNACDSYTANTRFSTVWVDSAHSCSSPATATTVVTVNDPPKQSPDGYLPPTSCPATNYGCLQVIIQSRVPNYLMGVFGIPTTTVVASAVVQANPGSGAGAQNVPPSNAAIYVYEPHSDFDPSKTPAHALAADTSGPICSTSCPTFWAKPGSTPTFQGYNASRSGTEAPTIESNGDMVMQGKTTFCDPTQGTTCQNGHDIGTYGWAINSGPGSLYYCTGLNGVNPGGCTNSGQSGLNQLWGTKQAFSAESWTPTIPAPSNNCSNLDLVLYGQSVYSATSGMGCQPPASEPYTIMPDTYHSITINHGAYEFGSGVFEITGTAPVIGDHSNADGAPTSGCNGNHSYNDGYGIDHCLENNANDQDLCNTNGQSAIACPELTAAVWIGHGSGAFAAASTGTSNSCTGGVGDTDGGGGDQTQVTGSGVTFVLDSGGFVSTNEVQLINLQAPAASATTSPILFDETNNSFIHLDAGNPPPGNAYSKFSGLVYQGSGATAGGVEMDASLSHNNGGGVTGQIIAYSLTVWGNGNAVDFSGGWGTGANPPISTSGHNENSIIGTPTPSLSNAVSPYPSTDETFTLNYTDEWSMDAYDAYLRINGGTPIFFSQNEWSTSSAGGSTPPAGGTTAGTNSNPNDTQGYGSWPYVSSTGTFSTTPAYPPVGTFQYPNTTTSYTVAADPNGSGNNDDFTETLGSGSATSYFEISGAWTWGHQKDIGTNPVSGAYNAVLSYTFPAPSGSSITIAVFMTDGDHCGDYATGSFTFSNLGSPGSVELVQ